MGQFPLSADLEGHLATKNHSDGSVGSFKIVARIALLFFLVPFIVDLVLHSSVAWFSIVSLWALAGIGVLLSFAEVRLEAPAIPHGVIGVRMCGAWAAEQFGIGATDVAPIVVAAGVVVGAMWSCDVLLDYSVGFISIGPFFSDVE